MTGNTTNSIHEMAKDDPMIGKMVEVHLLNDKRFLGKVRRRDRDGVTLYCIPLSMIDTLPQGSSVKDQLGEILSTIFFPYVNIEYIDIGGEPVGFDSLFSQAFDNEPLESLFEYPESP
ncbi:MAG: hypothetical protein H6751_09805 [Candidatus Omnitrophica bacterium]|nr:hypothetical protein [Candidatus Omnitrophota bacterium]MCA9424170.1 hypothetical protein [Candidatus Omnitrophota bacterium]MCA9439648.1 hypothetical protein [Candidatus Omnitrophota bacterium]MCB9767372.1 hypothetical protein [Candidatus Omnitrophota bacterium]MCB9783243.1 hypothetical protein [Candidatus Omnitrophota bacterium]